MKLRHLLAVVAVLTLPVAARAQVVLYSENFDSGTAGANWTTNVAPATAAAGNDANFAFDYSTAGIPAAPNSAGTTVGVRLRANRPGTAIFSGISVSPTG